MENQIKCFFFFFALSGKHWNTLADIKQLVECFYPPEHSYLIINIVIKMLNRYVSR